MLDEVEPQVVGDEQENERGSLGGGCSSSAQIGLTQDPLVLLLKVTQLYGKPFPIGILTVWAVMQYITEITGATPVDVNVLTYQEVIVQMELVNTCARGSPWA